LLYLAWQMEKSDTFHITKARRNSLLIMLEGAMRFEPAGGEVFSPFTLLQGQFVWMPMAPVDYLFSPEGEKHCRMLELHYSNNLLRNLEARCREGERPERFKNRWCGKNV
jgi:hypothetical protein